MNREFTTYKQALALKELGFDEPCLARHIIMTEWEKPTGEIILQMVDCLNSDRYLVKAPLYQQAFRFFREKHDLQHDITKSGVKEYFYEIYKDTNWRKAKVGLTVKTYEEAEKACLDKLIEIVKNKS